MSGKGVLRKGMILLHRMNYCIYSSRSRHDNTYRPLVSTLQILLGIKSGTWEHGCYTICHDKCCYTHHSGDVCASFNWQQEE